MRFPDLQPNRWADCPQNPLVGFFHGEKERYAIGDPQILLPGEFDNRWHMFYHGFFDDYIPYLYHLTSEDGISWAYCKRWQINVGPGCLFKDGGRWILYSSEVIWRDLKAQGLPKDAYGKNVAYIIQARVSEDLEEWSDPVDILTVDKPWEEVGPEKCVRNPCMVRLPNGRYRLYYSGGSVLLPHCNYPEPLHIGVAESDSPLSGFVKRDEPILSPDPDNPFRNLGSGAIKVYGWEEGFIAFYNPIYLDENGYPRSAVAVMVSQDGIRWEEAPYGPILLPGMAEWKKALVYQLDCVTVGGELRVYYNARDEWLDGMERIGLSVLQNPPIHIRKLM